MNNLGKYFLICSINLFIGVSYSKGAIGCLDTSYHTSLWGDFKHLHLVSCTCPCGSDEFHRIITTKRNRCMHCKHYRFASFYNPFINRAAQRVHFIKQLQTPARPTHPQGTLLNQLFGDELSITG